MILNIGLDVATGGRLDIADVAAVLHEHHVPLLAIREHQSDTEATAVVRLSCDPLVVAAAMRAAYDIAEDLGQDCIAVYNPIIAVGQLIGPRAERWGTFNPAFFLLPDGSRLAEPVGDDA